MENRVEGGACEPLVAAASPICPKCKTYFRFTDTFLDLRRNLIIRLFRCECGQLIWDERPAYAARAHFGEGDFLAAWSCPCCHHVLVGEGKRLSIKYFSKYETC